MVVGDGIDNDCDGKIDEELCTAANNYKGNLLSYVDNFITPTFCFNFEEVNVARLDFLLKVVDILQLVKWCLFPISDDVIKLSSKFKIVSRQAHFLRFV
jgi:hypothetical protein